MSILSTAVIAASIFSTSFTGGIQAQVNARPVSNKPQQAIVREKLQDTLQNNKQLQDLLKKSGIAIDSIKDCIIIPPNCNIPNVPDNGDNGTEQPDDSNQPDDTETPDDNNGSGGGDGGDGGDGIETPDDNDSDNTDKPDESDKPDNSKPDNKPNGDQTEDGSEEAGSSFEEQVVSLVNEERAKNNLAPLTMDTTISAAALTRAKEITVSFSHTRPNGSSFSTALKEQGVAYRTSGENIAWGQRTPQQVVDGWMNSAGHRANILNTSFGKIGVGYYVQNGTPYWVQLFTN